MSYFLCNYIPICLALTCFCVRASLSTLLCSLCSPLSCCTFCYLSLSWGLACGNLFRCGLLQEFVSWWLLAVKYHFKHFIAFLGLISFWGEVGWFERVLMKGKCSRKLAGWFARSPAGSPGRHCILWLLADHCNRLFLFFLSEICQILIVLSLKSMQFLETCCCATVLSRVVG